MKTVSLELAKQLKEAGYSQETHFKYCGGHTMYWEDQENGKYEECANTDLLDPRDEYCHTAELTCEFTIAAPTADEILDQLPWDIKDGMDRGRLVVEKSPVGKPWKVTYVSDYMGGRFALSNDDDTIADSAAKMWLHLKKEKLI